MGCSTSAEKKPPAVQTDKNTINLLNLGVGGCGKTTFVKQMKIIHSVDWDELEIATYQKIIKTNFINGLQDLITLTQKQGKKLSAENESISTEIMNIKARNEEKLTPELGRKLLQVWKDPVIQGIAVFTENLTYIHLPYFFEHIDRIMSPDYLPDPQDILRARQRTAGANSTSIWIDKNWFTFWDIGGQKPERAKWEQVLNENKFSAILYFVAADEFDTPDEDKEYEYKKMEMSKMIFRELLNSDIIPNGVPVILFMNRSDLFQVRWGQKEGQEAFRATFPDFVGDTSEKALDFLKNFFLEVLDPTVPSSNPVKSHVTCALDTESMLVVWRSVREYVMKEALKDLGLLM